MTDSGVAEPAQPIASTRPPAPPAPAGGARAKRERALAAAVLALTVTTVSLVFWPGHMNADTLSQLEQVRTGSITDWHAPVVQWLWHLVWPLGVGPGWALAAAVAALATGSYLILRVVLRPLAAALAAAAISFAPQVLGYLGAVSRDTWFAALLILTFGLLAAASQRPGPARLRLAGAALLVGWLALATRQNAPPALVPAFALAAAFILPTVPWIGERWPAWSPRGRVAAAAASGVAACVVFGISQLALAAAVGVRDARPEQSLYVYDLAQLSDRTGQVLLPAEAFPAQDLELLRSRASSATIGPLIYGPAPVKWPADEAVVDALEERWIDAIGANPLEYAGARFELLLNELGLSGPVRWVYHPGIDPNDQGFAIANPDLDEKAVGYLSLFNAETASGENNGTIVHEVWLYLLICIVTAIAFLRRGTEAGLRVAGVLGLAIVLFQIGVLAMVMTAQFRFEFATVVAGSVLAVVLAARLLRRLWPAAAARLGNLS